MKKKILILLVAVFSLFLMACGKPEGEESTILDTLKNEENIASKNIDKYNSYISFYNVLNNTEEIYKFDEEYVNKVFNENGDIKKLEKKTFQKFGEEVKEFLISFENSLNDVKKHIKEKPEYDFDPEVEKVVDTSFKLKEQILLIIEYYKNGEFETDNYEKVKKLEEEYIVLLNDFTDGSELYFDNMDKLEIENNRVLMKKLEKTGEISLLTMIKFGDITNEFSDLLYNTEEKFIFSAEGIKEIKKVNEDLVQELAKLEALTDKQLEKENIDKNKFKNNYVKSAKEAVHFSTAIVKTLEKKHAFNDNELDGFDKAHSDLVDAHNSML